MWDWREEDFALQKDSELVPECLWNDMNQNENSLLHTLGEHTPTSNTGNFGYESHSGDKTDKGLEEPRGSQFKRRRMLQYPPEVNDTHIGDEQAFVPYENSKEFENSLLADEMLECLEWNPEWNSTFSDDRCTFANESLDQSSEGWLANCLSDTDTHRSSGEMSSCMNDSFISNDQVEVSESVKIPSGTKSFNVKEQPNSSICKIYRGRKSVMNTPTKLTTTVAYPFTLIKPYKDQGDVTLKDINQRIHTPPKSKDKEKEDPSPSYPTSAFSGKPVVVKTKIRTEGGKGSITIMRTKG
ncbi:protein XRI1-like isoform X2 [Asparagus officinalis]|nr:protein XRI1-like isoform X2 [Asparagus officinalis]XP_020252840.1 protein XRI1-like isoform X2 [Asparagus officinalis]